MTARKGLREFVSGVLPRITARHPEVRLVVVGGEAVDALHSASHSSAELMEVAATSGVEQYLSLIGRIGDRALEDAWAASAVHVFPVREIPGDPEGFGMVAMEAAAPGVPTVAYAVGGVPDRSEEQTSELQSLMRISYAVFCLKKKKKTKIRSLQHKYRQ